jgi:uncharacterized protein (DUF779 family)
MAILSRGTSETYYPKDGFCVHRSGERLDEAGRSPAIEISQNRFDPASDTELAIDMVEVGLHGIERDTQLIRDVLISPPR